MGMVAPRAFHSCWRHFALDQIQFDAYCTVVWRWYEATFKLRVMIPIFERNEMNKCPRKPRQPTLIAIKWNIQPFSCSRHAVSRTGLYIYNFYRYSIILLVLKKLRWYNLQIKNITQTDIRGKKFDKKKKKKLKTYVLLENNQPITQCQVKRKNTKRIPSAKHKSARNTKLNEIRIPTESKVIYLDFTKTDHQDDSE